MSVHLYLSVRKTIHSFTAAAAEAPQMQSSDVTLNAGVVAKKTGLWLTRVPQICWNKRKKKWQQLLCRCATMLFHWISFHSSVAFLRRCNSAIACQQQHPQPIEKTPFKCDLNFPNTSILPSCTRFLHFFHQKITFWVTKKCYFHFIAGFVWQGCELLELGIESATIQQRELTNYQQKQNTYVVERNYGNSNTLDNLKAPNSRTRCKFRTPWSYLGIQKSVILPKGSKSALHPVENFSKYTFGGMNCVCFQDYSSRTSQVF